jgi:hypothetical protein
MVSKLEELCARLEAGGWELLDSSLPAVWYGFRFRQARTAVKEGASPTFPYEIPAAVNGVHTRRPAAQARDHAAATEISGAPSGSTRSKLEQAAVTDDPPSDKPHPADAEPETARVESETKVVEPVAALEPEVVDTPPEVADAQGRVRTHGPGTRDAAGSAGGCRGGGARQRQTLVVRQVEAHPPLLTGESGRQAGDDLVERAGGRSLSAAVARR